MKKFFLPNTLGGLYASFTEFLGFRPYHDEGKVMGLASYGNFDQKLQEKMDKVITYDKNSGDFKINPNMRYIGEHTYGTRFTDEFVDLFGKKRERNVSALEYPYPDIAFALQWRLEQIVITLAKKLHEKKNKLVLSNSNVPLVLDTFEEFSKDHLQVRRTINAKKPGSTTNEVIIYN